MRGANVADVKYIITVDESGATKKIETFDKAIVDLGKSTGKTDSAFGSLWKQFAIGQVAVNALYKGWSVFKNEMVSTVREAIEAEQAERRLRTALEMTGRAHSGIMFSLVEFSKAQQKATLYTDEQIQSTLTLLAQLTKLDSQGLQKAAKGAMGLAAVMGIDLESAALMVSKAMEGNVQALERIGIRLDDNVPKEEQAAAMLEKLVGLYGRATAETESFGGEVQQLKKAWGELKEEIGRVVTESTPLTGWIKDTTKYLQDMNAEAKESALSFKNIVAAWAGIGTGPVGALATAAAAARGAMRDLGKEAVITAKYIKIMSDPANAPGSFFAATTTGAKSAGQSLEAFTRSLMASKKEAKELTAIPFKLFGDFPPEKNVYELTKLPPAINRVELVMQSLTAASKLTGDRMKKTWAETAKAIAETMDKIRSQSSEAFSILNSIFSQSQRNREIAIENEYKKRLDAINLSILDEEEKQRAVMALEAEYQLKRTSAARAAAKQQKAVAMMEAIVNTASAVTEALPNLFLAALVGALGAAQIAKIAAQPIPLAKGGYFKRPTLLPAMEQTYVAGEAGAEVLSPVPVLRQIVREEGGRRGGGVNISFAPGAVVIQAQTLDDRTVANAGRRIFAEMENQARLRGRRLMWQT
jgi:hypothetical protein